MRQQAAEVGADGVDGDVEPAADGVVGRVLPGLQAVAMAEVVGGLPVVEGLVAVLDRGEEGGDGVGGQEDVEGRDGLDGEGVLDGPSGGGKCQCGPVGDEAAWRSSMCTTAPERKSLRVSGHSLFPRMLCRRVHKLFLLLAWRSLGRGSGRRFGSHCCVCLSLKPGGWRLQSGRSRLDRALAGLSEARAG